MKKYLLISSGLVAIVAVGIFAYMLTSGYFYDYPIEAPCDPEKINIQSVIYDYQ